MDNKTLNLLMAFALSFTLVGCNNALTGEGIVLNSVVHELLDKDKDEEKRPTGHEIEAKVITQKMGMLYKPWGSEYEIPASVDGNPQYEKYAASVGHIMTNSSAGTGFFISSNGLFITNTHIVSKSICAIDYCDNIQIIRDFRRNGAREVFTKVRVIAQSEELDIAVLQVAMPEGNTTPYLELDYYQMASEVKNQELVVIGHPEGATTRATDIKLNQIDELTFDFFAVAIEGNSGSPIINKKTDKVVGVHFGTKTIKEKATKNGGEVYLEQKAIKIFSFIKALEKTTDVVLINDNTKLNLAVSKILSDDIEIETELIANTRDEFFTGAIDNKISAVFHLSNGLDYQKELVNDALDISYKEYLASSSNDSQDFLEVLRQSVIAAEKGQFNLDLIDQKADKLAKIEAQISNIWLTRYDEMLLGSHKRDWKSACYDVVDKMSNTTKNLLTIVYCESGMTALGNSLGLTIKTEIDKVFYNESLDEDYKEEVLSKSIASYYLLFKGRLYREQDVELIMSELEEIITKTNNTNNFLSAEGLKLLYQDRKKFLPIRNIILLDD